jgi:hypothetical protein
MIARDMQYGDFKSGYPFLVVLVFIGLPPVDYIAGIKDKEGIKGAGFDQKAGIDVFISSDIAQDDKGETLSQSRLVGLDGPYVFLQ